MLVLRRLAQKDARDVLLAHGIIAKLVEDVAVLLAETCPRVAGGRGEANVGIAGRVEQRPVGLSGNVGVACAGKRAPVLDHGLRERLLLLGDAKVDLRRVEGKWQLGPVADVANAATPWK